MENKTMRIPVQATYRMQPDGTIVRVEEKAEWAEITPEFFARFLMQGLGIPLEEVKAVES